MPVLEERHTMPRSSLRYRPLAPDQAIRPDPRIVHKPRFRADVRTTTSTVVPDDLDQEEEYLLHRRRSASPAPRTATAPSRHNPRRFHPLVLVGLAMLIMILGWFALSTLGSWWQTTQDDWHYGRPRTFQIDQVVGHHDSTRNPSHFIAINLDRRIVIIEIPGGDVAHAVVYSGPVLLGPGQDLTPVTLSFQDVQHNGRPEMIVTVAGSQLVFVNVNGTFVAPAQNGAG